MKKSIFLLLLSTLFVSGTEFSVSTSGVNFSTEGEIVLQSSKNGLWAIAQNWVNNRPTDFVYANPSKVDVRADCTIVEGSIKTDAGLWKLKDIYSRKGDLVKCVRRYSYTGKDVSKVSLHNEFSIPVKTEKILIPSVIYYGNPSGYIA